MSDYTELGTSGLQQYSGLIQQAYNTELRWPKVQPLYSRLRRSDPEITIVREVYTALARAVRIDVKMPDKPSEDDKRFRDFLLSALDDMEGGQTALLETIVSHVPFWGWGWWEAVAGVRSDRWAPPDKSDDWRSDYNDGLIGLRRLAWRDPSAWWSWEFSPSGRLLGMHQMDTSSAKPPVMIPLSRSMHLTFGDSNNPEGLSPLEAVWRLERIKYALELVMGIGFEHSAGYLDVTTDEAAISDATKKNIKDAARAVATAQEGNYAAWPKGVKGQLMDVGFAAATSLLEAIRYYGILKLQIYNMQWVAMSSTTGNGSRAANGDSSQMFVTSFNAMMEGFVDQIDAQIGRRLLAMNRESFKGITSRPRLVATPVEKAIGLDELGNFLSKINFDLTNDDILAIRKRSGFLPASLPEDDASVAVPAQPAKKQPAEAQQSLTDRDQIAALVREYRSQASAARRSSTGAE